MALDTCPASSCPWSHQEATNTCRILIHGNWRWLRGARKWEFFMGLNWSGKFSSLCTWGSNSRNSLKDDEAMTCLWRSTRSRVARAHRPPYVAMFWVDMMSVKSQWSRLAEINFLAAALYCLLAMSASPAQQLSRIIMLWCSLLPPPLPPRDGPSSGVGVAVALFT